MQTFCLISVKLPVRIKIWPSSEYEKKNIHKNNCFVITGYIQRSGDRDEVIHYQSSINLRKHLKNTDRVIILNGQGHNDMTDHPVYKTEIQKILGKKERPGQDRRFR